VIDQQIASSSRPELEPRCKGTISGLRSREMGGDGDRYVSDEAPRALTTLRYPIIGTSAAIRAALRDASRAAPTGVPILLLGQTGTGKELFARAIHEWSRRAARPIVRVDCGSLTISLGEREPSGNTAGAFGGATPPRGPIELASGGTLFLDEIADLSIEQQSKLLHVLQEAEGEQVGSPNTGHADVRIITATNRVLADDVDKGRFRADLYYRIAGFVIRLPALRERREDIVPLITHFMSIQAKRLKRTLPVLSAEVLAHLASFDWAGNVRELRRAVERAYIVAQGGELRINDFGIDARRSPGPHTGRRDEGPRSNSPLLTLRESERQHIAAALRHCAGVIEGRGGAAAVLGLPPSTLRFRIRKHGIELR
jgi:DNA-binding NtrC family response regulator